MSKHILAAVLAGVLSTWVIVWGAAVSAFPAGGAVLLAATVDGLLVGLCIGGLIGANFALAAIEEKKKKEQGHRLETKIPLAA